MLRRLNVRTRLVAIIAVPLLLLFAVSGPEILQRRNDAKAADRAATLAAEAQQVIVVVDALQAERTLSAAHRAGAAEQVAMALADQRTATDTAIAMATPALSHLAEDPRLASEVGVALDALAGLPQVRQDTDVAESLVPWGNRSSARRPAATVSSRRGRVIDRAASNASARATRRPPPASARYPVLACRAISP